MFCKCVVIFRNYSKSSGIVLMFKVVINRIYFIKYKLGFTDFLWDEDSYVEISEKQYYAVNDNDDNLTDEDVCI